MQIGIRGQEEQEKRATSSLLAVVLTAAGWAGSWERVALTAGQVHDITPIYRRDGRDGQVREAWELQALGQAAIVDLLRGALAARLAPVTLASAHERAARERAAILDTLEAL